MCDETKDKANTKVISSDDDDDDAQTFMRP